MPCLKNVSVSFCRSSQLNKSNEFNKSNQSNQSNESNKSNESNESIESDTLSNKSFEPDTSSNESNDSKSTFDRISQNQNQNKWFSKLAEFKIKWDGIIDANLNESPELEKIREVITLSTPWEEITRTNKQVFKEAGFDKKDSANIDDWFSSDLFGLKPTELSSADPVLEPEKWEKELQKRWKENQIEMITLTDEERIQYARMVRHVEEEHDIEGETKNDLERVKFCYLNLLISGMKIGRGICWLEYTYIGYLFININN